jgi:hypothetical protein
MGSPEFTSSIYSLPDLPFLVLGFEEEKRNFSR